MRLICDSHADTNSSNMTLYKKLKIFNKLPIYFGEDKTKSILFSMVKDLYKINTINTNPKFLYKLKKV